MWLKSVFILAKISLNRHPTVVLKNSILGSRNLCYPTHVPVTWTGNRRRFVVSGTVWLSAAFTAAEMLISMTLYSVKGIDKIIAAGSMPCV